MADDRLPSSRSVSIAATSSDKLALRLPAISLRPVRNASSRLTLVLWPPIMMERLTTRDFMVIAGLGAGWTIMVASLRLPGAPATDACPGLYRVAGCRTVLAITSRSISLCPHAADGTSETQRQGPADQDVSDVKS